jgi:hypothetical protein
VPATAGGAGTSTSRDVVTPDALRQPLRPEQTSTSGAAPDVELREHLTGEFDPGSGQTLAACLTHASRTGLLFRDGPSGGRVRNTWATCRAVGDTPRKRGTRPHALVDVGIHQESPLSGDRGGAGRGACGRLAGWRGRGPPRRRSVAGLRGRSATLGLRTAQTPTGGSSEGSSAMGASLTERRRVREDGPRVVNRFSRGRGVRTVPEEEASANYVPAAAVIRRRRALSGVTGRKGCVGGRARGG